MFKIQEKSILEQLQPLQAIAHATGFDSNYTKKITARDFILGFLLMYNKGENSLESWASCIGQVSGQVVSKQALWLKFEKRHLAFVKALVTHLMQQQVADIDTPTLFTAFDRVLIEDSTCCTLDPSLANAEGTSAVFPSSYSHKGEAATLRLQCGLELKAHQLRWLAVQSFRDNDQKQAPAILNHAQAGDLVIRDLGYFSSPVFNQMQEQGVFFLSRLHYKINLYQDGKALDLQKLTKHKKQIDCLIEIGSKQRLPVRLVGFRLPQSVADKRRRKAKKDKRNRPSKAYLRYLGWSFYITNVPASIWSTKAVYEVYRLRWRIEIMFKTFKSQLALSKMLAKAMPANRVRITVYAMFVYILLCLHRYYVYFAGQLDGISLFKFAKWLRLHFEVVLMEEDLSMFLSFVRRHCCYERRRKRTNFYELMYS